MGLGVFGVYFSEMRGMFFSGLFLVEKFGKIRCSFFYGSLKFVFYRALPQLHYKFQRLL